jgi:hypothetical protein
MKGPQFHYTTAQWRTEDVWRPGQQGLSAPPPPNNVRNLAVPLRAPEGALDARLRKNLPLGLFFSEVKHASIF